MVHPGLEPGAAFALADAHAVFVLVLVVAALFLFTRWLETADRSAYAIGAICAVAAPVWLLVVTFLRLADDPYAFVNDVPQADTATTIVAWALRLAGVALLVALFWATWRPLWLTGFFARAPQAEVRRRWKRLETSWQFGIAFLVGAKAVVLLVAFAARWW